MKHKFLIALAIPMLILPTSCGSSGNQYAEYEEALTGMRKSFGFMSEEENKKAIIPNFKMHPEQIFEELDKVENKVPTNIEEYFFEAFSASMYSSLVIGKILDNKNMEFFDTVVRQGHEHTLTIKNQDSSFNTYIYYPDLENHKICSHVTYFDDTDFSFELFESSDEYAKNAYAYADSGHNFILSLARESDRGVYYSLNGYEGYFISDKDIQDDIFNKLDDDFQTYIDDTFEKMKNPNISFTEEEFRQINEELFPEARKYSGFQLNEEGAIYAYGATKNEEEVEIPENSKITEGFVIDDFTGKVKKLIIPNNYEIFVYDEQENKDNWIYPHLARGNGYSMKPYILEEIEVKPNNPYVKMDGPTVYTKDHKSILYITDSPNYTNIKLEYENNRADFVGTRFNFGKIKSFEYPFTYQVNIKDGEEFTSTNDLFYEMSAGDYPLDIKLDTLTVNNIKEDRINLPRAKDGSYIKTYNINGNYTEMYIEGHNIKFSEINLNSTDPNAKLSDESIIDGYSKKVDIVVTKDNQILQIDTFTQDIKIDIKEGVTNFEIKGMLNASAEFEIHLPTTLRKFALPMVREINDGIKPDYDNLHNVYCALPRRLIQDKNLIEGLYMQPYYTFHFAVSDDLLVPNLWSFRPFTTLEIYGEYKGPGEYFTYVQTIKNEEAHLLSSYVDLEEKIVIVHFDNDYKYFFDESNDRYESVDGYVEMYCRFEAFDALSEKNKDILHAVDENRAYLKSIIDEIYSSNNGTRIKELVAKYQDWINLYSSLILDIQNFVMNAKFYKNIDYHTYFPDLIKEFEKDLTFYETQRSSDPLVKLNQEISDRISYIRHELGYVLNEAIEVLKTHPELKNQINALVAKGYRSESSEERYNIGNEIYGLIAPYVSEGGGKFPH